MKPIRWGDSDKYFGPFTYSTDTLHRSIELMLASGDGDEYPGCRLLAKAFGRTLILALPAIIKPKREWIAFTNSDAGGYWDMREREYGFQLYDGLFSISYGAHESDMLKDKRKSWFIPWLNYRLVRHSYYGLHGEEYITLPFKERRRGVIVEKPPEPYVFPSITYDFLDFDGELIQAETRIEEMEWRLGEGWFKWLSWFTIPTVNRTLEIKFSKGTGDRKNSWKGGVIGTGESMSRHELHEQAFERYCDKNNMLFIGVHENVE